MIEKDYMDIGEVTPIKVFDRVLAEKEQVFVHNHKPFCSICARQDYKDKLAQAEKESERRHGFIKMDEIKLDIGTLEQYGKEDRFELLEDQEDVQDKVIEGSRTQVVIGHTLSYKCKVRGHGIAVFIPIEEYNALKKPKADKKEE